MNDIHDVKAGCCGPVKENIAAFIIDTSQSFAGIFLMSTWGIRMERAKTDAKFYH
jgi:hypothetical protein